MRTPSMKETSPGLLKCTPLASLFTRCCPLLQIIGKDRPPFDPASWRGVAGMGTALERLPQMYGIPLTTQLCCTPATCLTPPLVGPFPARIAQSGSSEPLPWPIPLLSCSQKPQATAQTNNTADGLVILWILRPECLKGYVCCRHAKRDALWAAVRDQGQHLQV